MPISPDGRRRRARVAALRRHHPDRPDLIADDQRALLAERIARDCERSGVPFHVEDDALLNKVAEWLAECISDGRDGPR